MKNQNYNIKQSFFFTFIMSNLNIDASQLDSSITQFSYAIFTLSLIALLSFINILGYILAYYIYKQVDYETKYPKLSKWLNRYAKVSLIYFSIDVFFGLLCLLMLVSFSFFIITSDLFKS